jgi:hypothetical protein
MTNKKALILSSFITIIVFGGFWPDGADAQEYSCQIKADRDNYHLFVRDFDRDGNPTRRVVYRGWLMRGQTIVVKSLSGTISIDFKADSAKRGSGSNEFRCRGNKTFRLQ